MSGLRQIIAVTAMNLRNLPARSASSLVIVVGIAGVVLVLIGLLSMAKGFEATVKRTGKADRALVLRGGAGSELASNIAGRRVFLIKTKPGILKVNGEAQAGGEIYVTADVPKKRTGSDANLPMRGVEPAAFSIRDEVRIIAGRNLEFGRFELIVGKKAAHQFQGLAVGNRVPLRGADWEVVGVFEADGGIHESEVWADAQVLSSILRRGGSFTSMVVQLESPAEFDVLEQALAEDPRLETDLIREAEYYGEQARQMTGLIEKFGYGVAFIMAIGAIFAALNTMYSAVSSRSVEIATLRALGFSPVPVVISVLAEALILAVIGGALGALAAYTFINGYTASTLGGSFTQVSFDFAVTGELIVKGIIWSCLLGLVGGLFPSINAARQPITAALRGM